MERGDINNTEPEQRSANIFDAVSKVCSVIPKGLGTIIPAKVSCMRCVVVRMMAMMWKNAAMTRMKMRDLNVLVGLEWPQPKGLLTKML